MSFIFLFFFFFFFFPWQAACNALVDESVRRWNFEEDVVDDTTCVIVYLGYKDASEYPRTTADEAAE